MDPKPDPSGFAGYLQSIVQLNAIENITNSLNKELTDSQKVMMDIKAIFDSVSTVQNTNQPPSNNCKRYEDISKFLDAEPPKLLLPDMAESDFDVDLDNVIATMKGYAEDLKKNFTQISSLSLPEQRATESLDIEQYASSLSHLSKRLANIKLSKKEDCIKVNTDLESKLTQLCEDVNLLTQMVNAKTTVSEQNKSWTEKPKENSNALYYDSIIDKLLQGINEVSYLLQNKN